MIEGILKHPENLKGWGARIWLKTIGNPHEKTTVVHIEIPVRNEHDADEMILSLVDKDEYEIKECQSK